MTRILNFTPIGSGGGLQNALSFLDTLSSDKTKLDGCVALVRRGSEIEQLCSERNIDHKSFTPHRIARLVFELRCKRLFSRGQTCFTIFGPSLSGSERYFLNVNGCAYSNLFYPEIMFWAECSRVALSVKNWIDFYRKHWTAKADYWIFETEALKRRAVELCGFPESRVDVVRMAPSSLVSPDKVKEEQSREIDERIPNGFRFLFLSGAQPNKRIWALPKIALELRKRGEKDFVFVTTMPTEHPHAMGVAEKFRAFGTESHWCNIGPISPACVSSLIDRVDAMCTFSRLESFSNNFIEAWRMRKPLLVTDSDWAYDSCGEAALYVNPEDATQAAENIASLMRSATLMETLVNNGIQQLETYPTPEEKLQKYFQCMESAENLGPCPDEQKRRIRWPKCSAS